VHSRSSKGSGVVQFPHRWQQLQLPLKWTSLFLRPLLFASDLNRTTRLIGLGAQMLPMEGTFYWKQDMQILSIKLRKSSIFMQKICEDVITLQPLWRFLKKFVIASLPLYIATLVQTFSLGQRLHRTTFANKSNILSILEERETEWKLTIFGFPDFSKISGWWNFKCK
jgi:hypothetical protein